MLTACCALPQLLVTRESVRSLVSFFCPFRLSRSGVGFARPAVASVFLDLLDSSRFARACSCTARSGIGFARPVVASVFLDLLDSSRFAPACSCSARSGAGFARPAVASVLLDPSRFARVCICSILLDPLVLVFARYAPMSSDFVSSIRLHTSTGRCKEKGPERRPPCLPLAAPSSSYLSRESLSIRWCPSSVCFARPAVASVLLAFFGLVFARPAVASVSLLVMLLLALLRFLVVGLGGGGGGWVALRSFHGMQ